MIPTRIRLLIPQVAKEFGIPEDHINWIITQYYKENKKLLMNVAHLHIRLQGLGIMTIKGWELPKEIRHKEFKLALLSNPENIAETTNDINNLQRAKGQWDIQEKEKNKVKQQRRDYYENKEKDNINESKG